MPPSGEKEKSSLKRVRDSTDGGAEELKKPRRSARGSQAVPDSEIKKSVLPSPLTHKETTTDDETSRTKAPSTAKGKSSAARQPGTPISSSPPPNHLSGLSSLPSDTQVYSQFLPPPPYAYEVQNEKAEGVWGYLIPVDGYNPPLVLRKRGACPVSRSEIGVPDGRTKVSKKHWQKKEEQYEEKKCDRGVTAEGYLIGRHPECDRVIDVPTVSNRHCLFFSEHKDGDYVAIVEDLSGNGTYVNDAIVGRNKRREIQDADEISVLDQARFIFRYPQKRDGNGFTQQYSVQDQLGKGHFATVYLATEKSSGRNFAVKKFEKRNGPNEKSKIEGLEQEIAVLMSVSHPNVLCLKDTFDEADGVYLVLELAPEGELFNWIVMKQKLSEVETRKVFVQLFQGVKYLHERNIVHRDIKPENILVIDKTLGVKIADFGLAKIIGEESFTTTLCGTPSYVAPEILENSKRRRYTRAVDVWSLGVVLYICLCGFPPFSDELYSPDNPYTLSQQIKMARFDYPSPYWDNVGDPALDLIDRMLTADVERRITIDGCLEHPWTTAQSMSLNDSTDGLTGALSGLDFSMRKPQRERTLLSTVNNIKVERVIQTETCAGSQPVKVFDKNSRLHTPGTGRYQRPDPAAAFTTKERAHDVAESGPDAARDPEEFAEMGGKGDQVLFGDDTGSRYPDEPLKASAVPQ